MNEMTREFCIELRGIELKDRNVLKRILAITEGRTRTYRLVDSTESDHADILIVNADDNNVKEEWAQEFIGTNGICMIPTILASRSRLEDTQSETSVAIARLTTSSAGSWWRSMTTCRDLAAWAGFRAGGELLP